MPIRLCLTTTSRTHHNKPSKSSKRPPSLQASKHPSIQASNTRRKPHDTTLRFERHASTVRIHPADDLGAFHRLFWKLFPCAFEISFCVVLAPPRVLALRLERYSPQTVTLAPLPLCTNGHNSLFPSLIAIPFPRTRLDPSGSTAVCCVPGQLVWYRTPYRLRLR